MDLRKWPSLSLLDTDTLSKIKFACVFGATGDGMIYVTDSYEVWACGKDTFSDADKTGPAKPKFVEGFEGKRIKSFVFGLHHIVALTEEVEVYTYGQNNCGQLGRSTGSTTEDLKPGLVKDSLAGKKIIEIACGEQHTLALSDEGKVFAWGGNGRRQVDSSDIGIVSCRELQFGNGKAFVRKISCCSCSSYALLSSGEVYSWGDNTCGQTGGRNASYTVNYSHRQKVECLSGVIVSNLVCGHSHVLALSDRGVLYTWGSNEFGQLGLGDQTNRNSPTKISCDCKRVIDIAASHFSHISAALTEDLKVYMWGQCRDKSVLTPQLTPYSSMHEVFLNYSKPRISYKPITNLVTVCKPDIPVVGKENVSSTLETAFDNPESSDFTVKVGDQSIYVHKTILALRCEYFRTMFASTWKEVEEKVLTVDNRSYTVYKAFLQYLYIDRFDLALEDTFELRDLAKEYLEEPLKELCEQIIKEGTTTENVLSHYSLAVAADAEELKTFFLSYALNHATTVVLSSGFSNLDKDFQLEFFFRAVQQGFLKT